ncbi:DUF3575 domain-containing protein [bacterium]|nr:DUF3575 domain-containing protein [bacterium]
MKKLLALSMLLACTVSVLSSDEIPADTAKSSPDAAIVAPGMDNYQLETDDISKNFIKFNLTSLAILNFSLQYERVFSRSVSGALAFAYMPENTIPTYIADQAIKQIDKNSDEGIDPEAEDIIRNLLISSYTITPEVRFYLGKNRYSTGFYISLFYRYSSYSFSNIPVPYTNDLDEDITIDTRGDIISHTGGFLLGYQWALGKHMCLDWQIFGPHYGVSSGDFLGIPSSPLSLQDQADIEEEFLKVESSLVEQTVDASADEVKMLIDGPWGGLRFAVTLGVKF